MALCSLYDVKEWLKIGSIAISDITNASAAVVTTAKNHNFPNGLKVIFSDVKGMTELNGQIAQITVDNNYPTKFTIDIDTTDYGTYAGWGFVSIDDNLLNRLIEACSADIDNEASRTLASTTHEDFYSGYGNGQMTLVLRNYPITAVEYLYINDQKVEPKPAGFENFFTQGFSFDNYKIALTGHIFARGNNNIAVKYTAGYVVIPEDLRNACVELISYRYRFKERIGIKSKSLATESVSYDTSHMPEQVMRVVERYKRRFP